MRLGVGRQRRLDSRHDPRSFFRVVEAKIEGYGRLRPGFAHGNRRLERDGSAPRLVARGKDLRESAVDPFHQTTMRTEVVRERQRLEHNATDVAPPLRFEKQADVGIAEAVDRLHRIADEKQRVTVAGRPAGG